MIQFEIMHWFAPCKHFHICLRNLYYLPWENMNLCNSLFENHIIPETSKCKYKEQKYFIIYKFILFSNFINIYSICTFFSWGPASYLQLNFPRDFHIWASWVRHIIFLRLGIRIWDIITVLVGQRTGEFSSAIF